MNEDPGLRDFINRSDKQTSQIHLLQFPSERGSAAWAGRPGTARAPELIRARLLHLTPHPAEYQKHTNLLEKVYDSGVVPATEASEEDQTRLGETVSDLLERQKIPVIIGGGPETSFGHFLGYTRQKKPMSLFKIDAHTDVRIIKKDQDPPETLFSRILDHHSGVCKSYHISGLNPSAVSFRHYSLLRKKGTLLFDRQTNRKDISEAIGKTGRNIMVSMNMDAVSQSEAPGVSRPNSSGITARLWLDLACMFGKHPQVTSFDLCGVNPVYDRSHQTVHLAALTVWYFLLGVSLRIT